MGRGLTWRRADLARDPVTVARELIGSVIESRVGGDPVQIRLTEVEAYAGSEDPGSHAFRGRTSRNAPMFGPAGHAYVYFTYGMHWCLNVVTGPAGAPSAVLLRAGEVVAGHETARQRRPGVRDRDLARGPARMTRALGVTGDQDGVDLLAPTGELRLLARGAVDDTALVWGPRVGVAGEGAATPWRVHLVGEATVSAYRPATPRRKPAAPA